jgi:hypothetical protein
VALDLVRASAAAARIRTARRHARTAHVPLHRAKVTRISVGLPRCAAIQVTARRALGPARTAVQRSATRVRPALNRLAPALRRPRLVAAAALLSCLALAAAAQGSVPGHSQLAGPYVDYATRVSDGEASRSTQRASASTMTGAAGGAAADARMPLDGAGPTDAEAAARQAQADAAAAQAKAAADAQAAAAAKRRADNPTPVAGLTQLQMNNALRIVGEGRALGLPKRAYVLAVACAMQESQLLNLASSVLPESYDYPHEGSGADHDSVGLFQQRPSSGWGSVKDLMTPAYAAKQFYAALVSIPGWQSMALTYAIQSVQRSAFPDAYAPHEWAAQTVVDALT